MMPEIVIFTFAYNAQSTIERTIKSVLRQSYADFEYHVLDNGCTDKTRQIIERYAAADQRIVPHYYDENTGGMCFIRCLGEYMESADTSGRYCCVLDADDEYKPEFLAQMLAFTTVNQLDVAMCGNDFIDAKTGKITGVRVLSQDIVLNDTSLFDKYFTHYHVFLRTTWAKFFSFEALKKCDFSDIDRCVYLDTMFSKEAVRHANSIGIMAQSFHKYYVSPQSLSHKWENGAKRIASDRILFDEDWEFLISTVGYVSPRNEDFLFLVYMNHVNDTLKVLLNVKISLADKIGGLHDMFTSEQTKKLIAQENLGVHLGNPQTYQQQRNTLFANVAKFLLSQRDMPDECVEKFCEIGELMCAATENADGWLFFKKLRVSFFIQENRVAEAKAELAELIDVLPDDEEIIALKKEFDGSPPVDAVVIPVKINVPPPVKLAILGVNQLGARIQQMIDADGAYQLLTFGDESDANVGKRLNGVEIVGLNTLKTMVRKMRVDAIVLANNNIGYEKMVNRLHKLGIYRIFILPNYVYANGYTLKGIGSELVSVDKVKPTMSFISCSITDKCQLNCKGCLAFDNLVETPTFTNYDDFCKTMDRLGELFDNIFEFQLTGGEPLLHPQLPQFIQKTRAVFPKADIKLISNGLMVPRADDRLFEIMRDCRVWFNFSAYQPTVANFAKIRSRIEKYNIPWQLLGYQQPITGFFKRRSLRPSFDPEVSFRNCSYNYCHYMSGSYLYGCSWPGPKHLLEKRFNVEFEGLDIEKTRIDILNTELTGDEINAMMNKPYEACRYCSDTIETWFAWEQVSRQNAKLDDYVVLEDAEGKAE
jgi:glycosyltransferase involved in cell wall biosynthesis